MTSIGLIRVVLFAACLLSTEMHVGAQPIAFGVKAGIPLTDALNINDDNRRHLDTGRWLVGPTVEVRLPLRFAIEADALYRRWSVDGFASVGSTGFASKLDTASWQFPVLLKYRILPGPITPFVSGGYEFNYMRTNSQSSCSGDPTLCPNPQPIIGESTEHRSGGVIGGGVEFRLWRLRVSPEVRYSLYGGNANWKNQAAVMVGLTF